MGDRAFIIAEAGSCHDGSLEKAYRLIDTAKQAGADACKFQYWSAAGRLAERRHAPEYLGVYTRYRTPTFWLEHLKDRCDEVGIEFMVTTYLPEDVATVAPFVERFKVASFEALDVKFLDAHLPFKKQRIVSTGMLEAKEIQSRLLPNLSHGDALLHCVSAYPTPLDEANIGAIEHLKGLWGLVGYSDHTKSLLSGAVAVGLGAKAIEKHFRLAQTFEINPDAKVALAPFELAEYIANVRLAERLIGHGAKCVEIAEEPMRRYQVIPT